MSHYVRFRVLSRHVSRLAASTASCIMKKTCEVWASVTKIRAHRLLAVGVVAIACSARSEPEFTPEGIYAMFTQSIARCDQMFPDMRARFQLADRTFDRYLIIDPVLRAAKSSSSLPQAKAKINAELDDMFNKYVVKVEERRSMCTDFASGNFGMLSLPPELFEEVPGTTVK